MNSQWMQWDDFYWTAYYLSYEGKPVWAASLPMNDAGCVPEFGLWEEHRWPEEGHVLI